MEKCLRCKSQESVFICMQCDSFKFLCTKCDSYVHGLPSKKNHKRNSLLSESSDKKIVENENRVSKETNEKTNWDFRFNLSPIAQNSTEVNFQSTCPIKVESVSKTNCDEKVHTSSGIGSYYLSSTNYSRDYLNELKAVYEKEKSELIFKNSTLQNNLDRLKISFTDQINSLNQDIEDMHNKNSIHFKTLQDNFDLKFNEVFNEKDNEINRLNTQIKELEKCNHELSSQLENYIKQVHLNKNNLTNQIQALHEDLMKKEDEVFQLKDTHDKVVTEYEKSLEEEKKTIVLEYENKIAKMLHDVEESREKMIRLLDDRERDIRGIIENHQTETENAECMIKSLKEEVECHKQNIIMIKNHRDILEEENERLKEINEKLRGENTFQLSEIKLLDNQSKSLMKENDDLKIQLSKLEKLIYGKIRPNFKQK